MLCGIWLDDQWWMGGVMALHCLLRMSVYTAEGVSGDQL